MEIFVVAAMATGMILLAGLLLARNLRYKALATMNRSYASVVLLVLATLLVCDLLSGGSVCCRLPVDLLLALIPMSLLPNSFISSLQKKVTLFLSFAFSGLLAVYYILCYAGLLHVSSPRVFGLVAALASVVYVGLFVWSIWHKLRCISALMQVGSVWTVLSLSVDAVYSSLILVLVVIYAVSVSSPLTCVIVSVLMITMVCALGYRLMADAVFFVFRRHERRIVESMRISPVEASVTTPGEENVYKELFRRIQEYFDEEKPFLNGNLTINDIVTRVFSNKVYISRAIVQCTGRNFCQYVNYHRIMYAMECFRNNTDLKISELWPLCGFNTIVSFNMAFRLFMDENPSEWCRKEKIRLSKKKK